MIWSIRQEVVRGGVWPGPWGSQEVRGRLELQNGGLRALSEAWIVTFRLSVCSELIATGRAGGAGRVLGGLRSCREDQSSGTIA